MPSIQSFHRYADSQSNGLNNNRCLVFNLGRSGFFFLRTDHHNEFIYLIIFSFGFQAIIQNQLLAETLEVNFLFRRNHVTISFKSFQRFHFEIANYLYTFVNKTTPFKHFCQFFHPIYEKHHLEHQIYQVMKYNWDCLNYGHSTILGSDFTSNFESNDCSSDADVTKIDHRNIIVMINMEPKFPIAIRLLF
ncbi:Hypothetical_protein [Hexamita inflata]|uniref:Hypothetical_protein n=1 Tax=Hexamita inflata TaxID=28002 RepID=A0AA86TNG2_9EUKA|nr:Hypothetical protein HINF_LOCUS8717 [Hexamita inflata]